MKLTAAFLAPLFLALVAPLCAQTSGIITPTTILGWNHSGLNALGGPETLQGFVVALADQAVDMNVNPGQAIKTIPYLLASVAVPGQAGQYQCTAKDLIAGIPDGIRAVWVQAVDLAANKSKWVRIQGGQHLVDQTPPADPTAVAWKFSLVTPDGVIWVEFRPN